MNKMRLAEYGLSLGLLLFLLFGPAWGAPAAQGDAVVVFGVT